MIARLGVLLYITFAGIAALLGLLEIYLIFDGHEPEADFGRILVGVAAVISFLIGRGSLYLFAGR